MDFVTTLLAICGGVSVIGGAWAVVAKFLSPAVKLHVTVQNQQKQIAEIIEKLDNDFRLLKECKEVDRLICRSLLDITNHMIYGNHTSDMKKTQKALLDYLSK